jgi:hypothetical protein
MLATTGWNIEVIYVGDWTQARESAFVLRDEWTPVWRPVEYAAFKDIIKAFRNAIDRRMREAERLRQRAEDDRLKSIAMRCRFYEVQGRYVDGTPMSRRDCERATARDLKLTVEEVGAAVLEAEQRGLFGD